MSLQRQKKPTKFHFINMNDPERYKKIKVAQACDNCRKRKSKCDIGVPGSGTCSNCQKCKLICAFSPITPRGTDLTPHSTPHSPSFILDQFPLLLIKDGQIGYERYPCSSPSSVESNIFSPIEEPSIQFESHLFQLFFKYIHPAYPVLLKQSVLHIHSQNRSLLSYSLRFAIMTLAYPYLKPSPCSNNNQQNYYHISKQTLQLSPPRLDTVQTLLLLYSHTYSIDYLETAHELVCQLQSSVPQQQEMIQRARWVLFCVVGLSNLSDPRYSQLYAKISLPPHLPRALDEEHETASSSAINQFAQLANLSVLYSHTVQSLMTGAPLICFQKLKEMRQHWHDSLHITTRTRLVTPLSKEVDILILYIAILYDMLYLLHHGEDDGTAQRLQYMVATWVSHTAFKSAFQSRRIAPFAFILCLQHTTNKTGVIHSIRQLLQKIECDPRLDNELKELSELKSTVSIDYFSLIPPHSTSSSPFEQPTPGLSVD